ncbi:sensor histidine kinase [Halonotius roseus]|uniref:histidine kinase n=1 Tax=Halonotius roseus TaxID=2511997 RepID=A0A544QKQ5_9EURY|nr:HAMP domain-containing sensor histidine kinase [Halonotius roseus]TQQ78898.1 HAMP domain-containing histidine kinase [Halonotius roseus]
MRRQLGIGVIAGIGVATAQLTVYGIISGAYDGFVGLLTDGVLTLLFSALVIGAGYWAQTTDRPDWDIVRLAAWCLAGSIAIGGFELLTALSLYAAGAAEIELLRALTTAAARGAALGIGFGLFDIERRRTKRRGAELERQVDRLEEFASVVSHDLRSPLTVAKGNMELIGDNDAVDEELIAHIEFAHDRMSEIIEDSLALARGGNEVTDPEPVDLSEIATQAWQTVGGDDETLTVDTELRLDADPERLLRLLENLFRNAIEHGAEGDEGDDGDPIAAGLPDDYGDDEPADSVLDGLSITVGRLSEGEGFYVADNGDGIPEEEREDIFEAGVSSSGTGSGLGLAIVRRIAQAHGWTVSVTDADGGGARFEFRIDPE